MTLAGKLVASVGEAEMSQRLGRLEAFNGLVIESVGPETHLGELCELMPRDGMEAIQAEVVGFRQGRVQGDAWQQGGLLLLDADGRVLHRQVDRAGGDPLDVAAVLVAAGRVPAAPGRQPDA